MRDRDQEETSTPIREASTVADRRKTEETVGGSEEMETDAEVGSTTEVRHEKHAIRLVQGQDTSMPMKEPQQATDDDGRMKPLRGKHEEENDESWHDARENWWEAVAYEKATNGDEAALKTTSSGAASLHTPVLEAPA